MSLAVEQVSTALFCADHSAFNLSPKTVANYYYEIKSKLGVRSDIELVYLCMRQGLVASLAGRLDIAGRGISDSTNLPLIRSPSHAEQLGTA